MEGGLVFLEVSTLLVHLKSSLSYGWSIRKFTLVFSILLTIESSSILIKNWTLRFSFFFSSNEASSVSLIQLWIGVYFYIGLHIHEVWAHCLWCSILTSVLIEELIDITIPFRSGIWLRHTEEFFSVSIEIRMILDLRWDIQGLLKSFGITWSLI